MIFQFIPLIIPLLIIAFIFLIIAAFIFQFYANNRSIIAAALVILLIGIAFFFESLLNHPLSAPVFNGAMRTYLIVTALLQTSLFVASLVYREDETDNRLLFQRRLLNFVFVPYVVISSCLLLFTEVFFTGDLWVLGHFGNYAVYGIPQAYNAVVWIIYQTTIYIFSIYNIYCVYNLEEADVFNKRSRLLILIAVILTGIAGVISSTLNYLESTGLFMLENRALWSYGYRLILLTATLSFFTGFVKYSAMIKVGRELVKDFFIYALANITIVLLYLIPLGLILAFIDFPDNVPIFILFACIVPIITHNGYKSYQAALKNFFESQDSTLSHITLDNIQYALKYAHSEKALSTSELLHLTAVEIESKRQNITKEVALKNVIVEVLASLKPDPPIHEKRARATLKYEILRMIVQEQAVESQILWDLGFKSKSIIDQEELPRYPIASNSDYTGTSLISYKRLRKEAFSEFMWQFRSYEQKILRLK